MRKLALRKDTLAELGTAELAEVVGAGLTEQCLTGKLCPTGYDCFTYDACFTTHGCA